MNEKKTFIIPAIEIVVFDSNDVIMTSNGVIGPILDDDDVEEN